MDLAFALRAFLRTVERGSMTAAARDLGISQPAVSKLLRNLEAHAGARLLERSSRALRPTAQGTLLYEASGEALGAIDAAIEAVRNDRGAITGALRLHCPVCLGESRLHRIAMDFQALHPAVSIGLTLENHSVDLIRENVDLALRMGRPDDGALIMRRIGLIRRILVASAAYLSRHRAVHAPADLVEHGLVVTETVLSRGDTLTLCRDGAVTDTPVRPILTTNNPQVLVEALRTDRGIGTTQLQLVADDLSTGRLVRVLPEYEIPPTELYLTYPSARFLRPTVRAFIDYVVPALQSVDGITIDHESDPVVELLRSTNGCLGPDDDLDY